MTSPQREPWAMIFPGRHFTRVVTIQRAKLVLCESTGGDAWKHAPSFLRALPRVPVPFASFYVCSFTVMKHSCENDSAES